MQTFCRKQSSLGPDAYIGEFDSPHLLSLAVINHHNHSNLGEERASFTYSPCHSLSLKAVRAGTLGGNCSRDYGGELLAGFLAFFLISPRTNRSTVGWAFPQQSLIKKRLQTFATGQSCEGIFSVKVPFS